MKFKIENIEDLSDSRQVMESKPNKFTFIFIYIVLGLIAAFLIWAWVSEKEIVVKAAGVVRPNSEIHAISNVIEGEVEKISMKDGQEVKKGQVLYKISSKALDVKKSQLKEQKEFLEDDVKNLEKLDKSIKDNKNYFEDSGQEKEYYYKYKSYESGNKVPLEDKESLKESKGDLSEEKEGINSLIKSIDSGENHTQKGSVYSTQYDSYNSSKNIINNKINQLEKAKNDIAKDSDEGKKQLEQIDLEIQNNKDQLEKLKIDTKAQLQATIDKLNKGIKDVDNNINKIKETTDIEKEKNKNSVLAQIQEKITLNNQKLDEIKLNLKEINKGIDKCTIKSPVDGKLDLKAKLESGMMIQTGAIIANILPNSKTYKVELMISNKDIANIKDGQEMKYSFDSLPYREYGFIEGKIDNISSDAKVDSEKGMSFYTAEGSLDSNSLKSNKGEESFIKPGMTCEGRIITRKERMLYYLLEKIGFKN